MRRRGILGIGAGLGAAVAAFFLHPRKGSERREAVVRRGGALVRRSAAVATRAGTPRHRAHRGDVAELRSRIEGALIDALGGEGLSLRVSVDEAGVVSVRGEVATLDQIGRASQAIEAARGGADVVNLVRLRSAAVPRSVAG
jgi:osmotically-inducible protein OsmY